MKSLLVILSVVGVSLAQNWGPPGPTGVPADTPEVAAAKASHLAALARAHQADQQAQAPQQQWNQPQQQWAPPQQPQQQWNQPQQSARWNGPVALPPGFDQNGAPLPVQDTAEVAAERARHFNLYSNGGHPSLAPAQPSWNAAPAQQSWNAAPAQQSWNAAPAQRSWDAPAAPQWNAAPAAPQWNAAPQWGAQAQPGLPQDTPEVAAARAAHLAAHAALPPSNNQGRWKRSVLAVPAVTSYSTTVVHSTPIVTPAHYVSHRLIAQPAVHVAPLAVAHW